MPIFEFVCQSCGMPFEELVRNSNAVTEMICPYCQSSQVKKKISTFAARVGGSRPGAPAMSSSACSTGSV